MLRHPADRRSVAWVALYLLGMASLYAVPATRVAPVFVAVCALSYLNAVTIHNHLHIPMFAHPTMNRIWSCILSFGSLYPASANLPAHNLVHHRFADGDDPDWASPGAVDLGHPLLDLLHFPNVVGPATFAGVRRWAQGKPSFQRQYRLELGVAFGGTALLLLCDFWSGLFFVVLPQLFGARNILRINLLQHGGCDTRSTHHSRDFVGRTLNYVMCNNGFHTVHHNRPGLHWSELPAAHAEARATLSPRLEEPSLLAYLWRRHVRNRPC